MTQAKLILSSSRDIPFNKLILSQANVRRIKAGVSIEELAEDIARRTLLQSLTVRPVMTDDGAETGIFEIPAGGRRYRALDLLVRQKRLAKTAPIPCVIRFGGLPEEDSLAENIQRAPLHPLDQFRAFLTLREKGESEEEIAAAFFVSSAVVRQRLRLAAVSPRLLDAYAEDAITLDQLMAFTVNGDHERQEQVFDRLAQGYREPYAIRRLLTEGAVRASDKRAQFIGVETYVEAGGTVLHDLFQGDDGGWLQDVALVERLVAERLVHEAEAIVAEGWRWTDVAIDLPYDHAFGLRRLRGEQPALTEEETAARQALAEQLEQLEAKYADLDELPEDVDQRFAEIETAIAAIDERPVMFDPEDVARGGAFISLDASGTLRIERGFVRPEEEAQVVEPETQAEGAADVRGAVEMEREAFEPTSQEESEEDEGIKPIPERLLTELTTFRTLALRRAVGGRPDVAFLAVLHALTLAAFYRYAQDTCLEIVAKVVTSSAQAPGLADSEPAKAIAERHRAFEDILPRESGDLWQALATMDDEVRHGLFAHCVGLTVNAVHEPWNRRPRALAHADQIAVAVDLDLAPIWSPTVDSYLGRVTKARIVAAVREAKGDDAAERIADLKKAPMAEQAQALLAGSGWLPETLRTPGRATAWEPSSAAASVRDSDAEGGESDANGGDSVVAEHPVADEDDRIEEAPYLAAAE